MEQAFQTVNDFIAAGGIFSSVTYSDGIATFVWTNGPTQEAGSCTLTVEGGTVKAVVGNA